MQYPMVIVSICDTDRGFESRIPFWLLGNFELEESNKFDLLDGLCLSNATISTSSTSLLSKIGYDALM